MSSKNVIDVNGLSIGMAVINNASVILNINSADRVVLLPRVTNLAALTNPVNGMMAFDARKITFLTCGAGKVSQNTAEYSFGGGQTGVRLSGTNVGNQGTLGLGGNNALSARTDAWFGGGGG